MAHSAAQRSKTAPARRTGAGQGRWKLEDAKARFSEVVRLAGTAGPQTVTVRGKEAAVIVAAEQYKKLLPQPRGQKPLVSFLRDLGLSELDLKREEDTGRDLAL